MGYTTSPLRYPGGKTRLANFIKHVIASNGLSHGTYVEAYAGGAGIAWSLLFDEYVHDVHINDVNSSVHAFWRSLFYHTEELCRLIQRTHVTMSNWHRQRAIQESPKQHSAVELGFSTFFLNRTNWSGIILGGVIGGQAQAGQYHLGARYNKRNLIARIEKIAGYRNRVHLYRLDAAKFISRTLPSLSAQALVYLDPPYYSKGSELYESHYQHEDHAAIAGLVGAIRQKWVVSYDDAPEIRALYQTYRAMNYRLSYSAMDRYSAREVMFFSPGLNVPPVDNPLTLKSPKLRLLPILRAPVTTK